MYLLTINCGTSELKRAVT